MGSYTPNRNLYKPAIGETGWGDKVNANWDILDAHDHVRSEITDFFSPPFWDNIPDKPSEFPPQPHTHEIGDIVGLADKLAGYDTQIDKIKKDVLTIALNVMMNKALLHAETKDFYSVIADVITADYLYGFKNTFETVPFGVTFDNDGGGPWTQAIKITLTTTPSEYAQYRIVITATELSIYAADGTLKNSYDNTQIDLNAFWDNVKSDGSDIRIADQNYSQLYFWIEEFDYANKKAVIWVRLEAGSTELNIAYGNPSAMKSSYENIKQVFDIGDDFEDGVIDAIWTIDAPVGSITESNGVLTISIPAGTNGDWWSGTTEYAPIIFTQVTTDYDWVAVAKLNEYVVNDQTHAGIMLYDDRNNVVLSGRYRADDKGLNCYLVEKIIGDTGQPKQGSYESTQLPALLKIVKKGNTKEYYVSVDNGATWNLMYSSTELTGAYIGLFAKNWGTCNSIDAHFDYLFIAKLTDPAEFGDAEVITLTTTGDYVTVTFDFDEGVDKLLITVDSDCEAVYYSTDGGATWNAIEPDTETLLSETAYSVKWKFENASYVRGYAFITW